MNCWIIIVINNPIPDPVTADNLFKEAETKLRERVWNVYLNKSYRKGTKIF